MKANVKLELLSALYNDSRIPITDLAKKLGLSHYKTSKLLEECERQYGLLYTVRISAKKLNLSGENIVAVKFKKRIPDMKTIKEELKDDMFVNNAYLCKGDFDLFLTVTGLTHREFGIWEWTLRALWSEYGAEFLVSTIDSIKIGMFKLSSGLILKSPALSEREKRVLLALNENSRAKLKDIASQVKASEIQVAKTTRDLQKQGIIKKFSVLIQKPDKQLLTAAFINASTPAPNHQEYYAKIKREVINEKEDHVTSDYAVACEMTGVFDSAFIFSFADGETHLGRGPNLWIRECKGENLKVSEAVLTHLIKGAWPFHADGYDNYKRVEGKRAEIPYRKVRDALKKGVYNKLSIGDTI